MRYELRQVEALEKIGKQLEKHNELLETIAWSICNPDVGYHKLMKKDKK